MSWSMPWRLLCGKQTSTPWKPPEGCYRLNRRASEESCVWRNFGNMALPTMTYLDAKTRARLPNSSFAYIDSRGRRRLPINDEAHVRNALSRFNQTTFEDEAARSGANEASEGRQQVWDRACRLHHRAAAERTHP